MKPVCCVRTCRILPIWNVGGMSSWDRSILLPGQTPLQMVSCFPWSAEISSVRSKTDPWKSWKSHQWWKFPQRPELLSVCPVCCQVLYRAWDKYSVLQSPTYCPVWQEATTSSISVFWSVERHNLVGKRGPVAHGTNMWVHVACLPQSEEFAVAAML